MKIGSVKISSNTITMTYQNLVCLVAIIGSIYGCWSHIDSRLDEGKKRGTILLEEMGDLRKDISEMRAEVRQDHDDIARLKGLNGVAESLTLPLRVSTHNFPPLPMN